MIDCSWLQHHGDECRCLWGVLAVNQFHEILLADGVVCTCLVYCYCVDAGLLKVSNHQYQGIKRRCAALEIKLINVVLDFFGDLFCDDVPENLLDRRDEP